MVIGGKRISRSRIQVDSELEVSPASFEKQQRAGSQMGSREGLRINGKLGNSGFGALRVTLAFTLEWKLTLLAGLEDCNEMILKF